MVKIQTIKTQPNLQNDIINNVLKNIPFPTNLKIIIIENLIKKQC